MERDELYHYSSISLPIHLSTFISINLPPCRVSINLSICRSFYLLTCLSVSISIYSHLSIILYLFRNLLSNLCIYITKHLSIHFFIYVFVFYLYTYPLTYLYFLVHLFMSVSLSTYICLICSIYLSIPVCLSHRPSANLYLSICLSSS